MPYPSPKEIVCDNHVTASQLRVMPSLPLLVNKDDIINSNHKHKAKYTGDNGNDSIDDEFASGNDNDSINDDSIDDDSIDDESARTAIMIASMMSQPAPMTKFLQKKFLQDRQQIGQNRKLRAEQSRTHVQPWRNDVIRVLMFESTLKSMVW